MSAKFVPYVLTVANTITFISFTVTANMGHFKSLSIKFGYKVKILKLKFRVLKANHLTPQFLKKCSIKIHHDNVNCIVFTFEWNTRIKICIQKYDVSKIMCVENYRKSEPKVSSSHGAVSSFTLSTWSNTTRLLLPFTKNNMFTKGKRFED